MSTREPISDHYAATLIEAAREGNIYDNEYTKSMGLPTVIGGLKGITCDQYIPKQVLADLLYALSDPVEEIGGNTPSGYIFGSGPINVFNKECCYGAHMLELLRDNPSFASIGHTSAARMLSDPKFSNLISLRAIEAARAEETDQITPETLDKDIVQRTMMGYKRSDGKVEKGIWDAVSLAFAENAHGHIITLTPWAKSDRIFVRTELPALLKNEQVETINGLPREDFINAFNDYRAGGLSDENAYAKLNRNMVMGASFEFIRNYSANFAEGLRPHLHHDFQKMTVAGYDDWVTGAQPVLERSNSIGHYDFNASIGGGDMPHTEEAAL